jgi:hypothetical protein
MRFAPICACSARHMDGGQALIAPAARAAVPTQIALRNIRNHVKGIFRSPAQQTIRMRYAHNVGVTLPAPLALVFINMAENPKWWKISV